MLLFSRPNTEIVHRIYSDSVISAWSNVYWYIVVYMWVSMEIGGVFGASNI